MKSLNLISLRAFIYSPVAAGFALLLTSVGAGAADGTLTSSAQSPTNINYTSGANWSGSVIAGGSGATAFLNTLNLTGNKSVINVNSITLGNIVFGDITPSNHGWLFSGSGLTLSGSITPTITVNNLGTAAATINVVTSGNQGLEKLGVGRLVFTAANTYTGTTTVTGGSLILSGSGSIANSATVDVQLGATLDTSAVTAGTYTYGTGQTVKGNGTITGNTILQGTLAAGNSPGLLTFSNDLMLASTTNSVFEIQNTGLVRGTDYDGVNVTGLLTYNGTLTLSLAGLVSSGGTFDLFNLGTVAGNFTSVVFSGGIYAGTFVNNSGIWSTTDTNGSGQIFSFDQASGDLIISAIPEPSTTTTLLLAGGLMALLLRCRRASHYV